MASDELLEIGHHPLRIVLSDVLGRRVDSVSSRLRQSSDALATWPVQAPITHELYDISVNVVVVQSRGYLVSWGASESWSKREDGRLDLDSEVTTAS